MAEAVIHDVDGPIGRSLQSLLVDRADPCDRGRR